MNDQTFEPCAAIEEAEPVKVASSAGEQAQARALTQAAQTALVYMEPTRRNSATGHFTVSRYNIVVALKSGGSLLFNSMTRSLLLLSEEETCSFEALGTDPFPSQGGPDKMFLQILAGGGHIVAAGRDELAEVQQNYDATRASKNALTLTIAPTMACNFACGYCFQGLLKPTKKMGREVQDAILTFIKAQDLKALNIVWYGGEPLMGRDSIYRLSDALISWCDKNGIAYSAGMVSNAWFLDGEVASQLHARRTSWVQVTIDGDRDTHDQMRPLTSGKGTYDRIIKNIGETLDTTPINISVRVNVGQSNVDQASAMLDEFAEHGFQKRGSFYVYFSAIEASTPESGTAFEERMSKAEFNKAVLGLEEKGRKLGFSGIQKVPGGFSGMCVAASSNGYVVAGNGDIHKCWETAHDPTKRIGTIFEPKQLGDSTNAAVWQEWTPFDNPVCSSCKILPMCGGHCAHRFIYGDGSALPCPSWKWNTADYIFSRARDLGVVAQDDWLPEEATVTAMQSGERHSPDSIKASQQRLLDKVSARIGDTIDVDALMAGEVEAGGIGSDRNV